MKGFGTSSTSTEEDNVALYRQLFVPASAALDELLNEIETSTSLADMALQNFHRHAPQHHALECQAKLLQQQNVMHSSSFHLSPLLNRNDQTKSSNIVQSTPASAALEAALLTQLESQQQRPTSKRPFHVIDSSGLSSSTSDTDVKTSDDFSDMFRSIIAVDNPTYDFPEIAWCTDEEETSYSNDIQNQDEPFYPNMPDIDSAKILTSTMSKNKGNSGSTLRLALPPTPSLKLKDSEKKRPLEEVCSSASAIEELNRHAMFFYRRTKTFRSDLCDSSGSLSKEQSHDDDQSPVVPVTAVMTLKQSWSKDSLPKCYSVGHLSNIFMGSCSSIVTDLVRYNDALHSSVSFETNDLVRLPFMNRVRDTEINCTK